MVPTPSRRLTFRQILVVTTFLVLCFIWGYRDGLLPSHGDFDDIPDTNSDAHSAHGVPVEKPEDKPKTRLYPPKFKPASPPTFSTVMPKISTFASYIAETGLEIESQADLITIFAPVNEAIAGMRILPHEGPNMKFEGDLKKTSDDQKRKFFLKGWMLSHILPVPWYSPSPGNETTASGFNQLHFEVREGDGPDWKRTTVNGAKILYKVKTDDGGQLYVVSDKLFSWETAPGPWRLEDGKLIQGEAPQVS